MKHPWAKAGYAAALGTGLLVWALATEEKGRHERQDRAAAAAAGSGGK